MVAGCDAQPMSAIEPDAGEGARRVRARRGRRSGVPRRSPGLDAMSGSLAADEELRACRAIADRCAFVIGPARSGTTILAQLINASDRAFLTTEALFHRASIFGPFRDWYNGQHRVFRNQICKSTYAPDFASPDCNSWWEWLTGASQHFDIVGDKLAFTHRHFDEMPARRIQEFYESRFFPSRYVFVFRNPVQSLLGSAVLGFDDARALIRGWGEIVMLWADMIRVFPSTMTVLLEELDAARVEEIGTFLGLDLSASARLLDAREQRSHRPRDVAWGEAVTRIAPLLNMIYGEIRETVAMDRVLLQADQKRDRPDGSPGIPGSSSSNIAVVSTPIGRAWNLADELVRGLGADAVDRQG